MNDRSIGAMDMLNLEQRRDALALECTYQIDVLMLLANRADELDAESQRAALRSLTIRARGLTAILMSILGGEPDTGVGDWELRVFGSLQGSATTAMPDLISAPRMEASFEPI
jgi:hypothetical protein